MDFFDNVKTVVGNTAEVVAKKSSELIEISKIKYSIYDLNSEIKRLTGTLGELVYTCYKANDEANDKIKEICEQIDAKHQEIAELKEQLNNIKNEVECPSCGKLCSVDTKYCPYCGGEVAVSVEAEVPTNTDYTEI